MSSKCNHLLKVVGGIHPKTDDVCVPIRPYAYWSFNPCDVPKGTDVVHALHKKRFNLPLNAHDRHTLQRFECFEHIESYVSLPMDDSLF